MSKVFTFFYVFFYFLLLTSCKNIVDSLKYMGYEDYKKYERDRRNFCDDKLSRVVLITKAYYNDKNNDFKNKLIDPVFNNDTILKSCNQTTTPPCKDFLYQRSLQLSFFKYIIVNNDHYDFLKKKHTYYTNHFNEENTYFYEINAWNSLFNQGSNKNCFITLLNKNTIPSKILNFGRLNQFLLDDEKNFLFNDLLPKILSNYKSFYESNLIKEMTMFYVQNPFINKSYTSTYDNHSFDSYNIYDYMAQKTSLEKYYFEIKQSFLQDSIKFDFEYNAVFKEKRNTNNSGSGYNHSSYQGNTNNSGSGYHHSSYKSNTNNSGTTLKEKEFIKKEKELSDFINFMHKKEYEKAENDDKKIFHEKFLKFNSTIFKIIFDQNENLKEKIISYFNYENIEFENTYFDKVEILKKYFDINKINYDPSIFSKKRYILVFLNSYFSEIISSSSSENELENTLNEYKKNNQFFSLTIEELKKYTHLSSVFFNKYLKI